MPMNLRETFPLTHEQAVKCLIETPWTEVERKKLLEASASTLHNNIGGAIREHWYLTNKTFPLTRHYSSTYGLGCPDDMCRLILLHFLSACKGEEFSVEKEVVFLRRHWLSQGIDPLTLERLPA